jgi:aromatic ring-opening dioxygenase catalytic subunit (LigB family)
MTATVVYIPHGGGPRPLLGDPTHQFLIEFLQDLPRRIPRPETVLVISAHWEQQVPTLLSGERPSLYYDYYGFPEESYRIEYPAPGHPQLAADVLEALHNRGIDAALDAHRGFDHGMFVPLKLMYPGADIPCVQLSLLANLDPTDHVVLGEALDSLLQRDLLILGSGMSFHNAHSFYHPGPATRAAGEAFNQWLIDSCAQQGLSHEERRQRLIHWTAAPSALACHPRPEHLLPLHVCFGTGSKLSSRAQVIFNQAVMGSPVVGFLWR